MVLFGVDAAAISLVFDGTNVGTLEASGVAARVYDELQFTLGEGPCLDSVAHRAPVVVVDLADPGVVRWPAYGPAMLAHQIAACMRCRWWWPAGMWAPWTCFGLTPVCWAEQLAGALVAVELAQMPLLDLLAEDLQAAVATPTAIPGPS